ncbi:MAG: GNAT family N-acetyltransferase [Myxococcales bacterium]
MAETHIAPAKGPGDIAAALAIREVVFIEEQAVPQDIERDDQDETAFHVLAMQGGHAVGTGRLVATQSPPDGESGRWGRIGRMAVLAANRKGGVGRLILSALEAHARELGLAGIVLHAQVMSKGFYEREGYEPFGAVFDEAGMPHVKMSKRL